MSDGALNYFVAAGTNADRLAFTPSPPTPAAGPHSGYFFFETDTSNTYSWNAGGAAWVKVNTGGSGTVTASGSPSSGFLAKWTSATDITKGDLSGDISTTGTLVTTIGALKVATGMIQASAVTLAKIANASANSKLLGSGASGSGAAYAELTLGTGLAMSGTTLSAAGAGFPLIVPTLGTIPSDTSIASPNALDAYVVGVQIAGTMLLDKVGFQVTTSGSGTCQWGLFDFSASATSATKLAGGTGALGSTGYQTIAAGSAPVTINPGFYALIVLFPSLNRPSIRRSTQSTSTIPFQKFATTYSWSDTPNLTSGWTADSVCINAFLHGRLASGTTW